MTAERARTHFRFFFFTDGSFRVLGLPLEIFAMKMLVDTPILFLPAFSVLRCSALGADDNIVILGEFSSAAVADFVYIFHLSFLSDLYAY